MSESADPPWLGMAVFVAVLYPVAGIAFAALAGPGASREMRITWRLAAWLVSAAVFAGHLAYEHFRLRNPPSRAALHVSLAVAFGAFVLAVWVIVHGHWSASSRQSPLASLALVVFPAVTGPPAFVVALAACTLLARARKRAP